MQGQWVQCPTCRQSTAAGYACQRCGAMLQQGMMVPMPYAQPQQSTGIGAVAIVLIVLGILVVLGGGLIVGGLLLFRAADDSSSSRYSGGPSGGGGGGGGSSSRSSGEARIGDEVDLDDSTWTVIDVKDMGKTIVSTASYSAGETKSTSGRFIRVHYKVVNDGKKQETLLDTPKIVDSKSREFGPVAGESEYVPVGTKTAILETIQPSMEKDFYTIIEIPPDAHDLQVMITGLGLLGDKKNVDIEM